MRKIGAGRQAEVYEDNNGLAVKVYNSSVSIKHNWVDAYCGNPLSDVARTYYLLKNGVSPEKKPYFVRLVENIAKKIIAKEYLHSYFGNKPIPKREFDIWQLIIQICRCADRIKEEKAYLQKSIPLRINKLMPFMKLFLIAGQILKKRLRKFVSVQVMAG